MSGRNVIRRLVVFSLFGLIAANLTAQLTPIPIKIDAKPLAGIEYDPLPAIFLVAPRGTTREASIEIVNRRATPLDISGIENPSARFSARVEAVEAGKRYRLIVSAKGEGPVGDRREVLRLASNLKDEILQIPVNIRVREKVYTFPASVFLGRFNIGQINASPDAARRFAQTLMVYRKGVPGFEVKVTSNIPFLKIESEKGPDGDQWQSWIWIDPSEAKVGEIQGTLFIETNDPEIPKLSVPVTGKLLPD